MAGTSGRIPDRRSGLFLGLSEGAKKTSWLVAFGVIGSAAVWARKVTGVYLFVACGPLLGAALLGVVLHSATPWRDVFRILVALGPPASLLVGLFLPPRIDILYFYYAVSDYGYQSIPKSFIFIGQVSFNLFQDRIFSYAARF